MRSQKLHSLAEFYLLGYSVPAVHVCMDAYVKQLGPQHRQLGHVYPFVEAMGMIFGEKGKICSLLHLFLDLDIIDSKYIESILPKSKRGVKKK